MKVRPLADRILVKREDASETVRGGIIIPDTAKEKPQEGKVVAVGPGRIDEDGTKDRLLTSAALTRLFGLPIEASPRGDWFHADIIA